ncbi:MAG: VTT domain-containing protein, partial [Myxococcota bacterium]
FEGGFEQPSTDGYDAEQGYQSDRRLDEDRPQFGAWLFKPTLEAAGTWFVSTFGLMGCFVGVLASDCLMLPIPPDTYLVASITANISPLAVLPVVCLASLIGGQLAYLLGPYLESQPFFKRRLEPFRDRGKALFRRWGILAVAIAAWTPLPFSFVCWFAGIFKMNYLHFTLTTLNRIPRFILYYYLIVLGWMAGSGAGT